MVLEEVTASGPLDPDFKSSGMSLTSCAGAPGSIPGLVKECYSK